MLERLTGLRRKLFYIPLAMHLSLQGCAMAQLMAPAPLVHELGAENVGARVVDSGEQGTHAVTLAVQPPAGYGVQALRHRWVATDVVKYSLALKVKNAQNTYDDVITADLPQKGAAIAQSATFTGLAAGKTYKVFLQSIGNNGGIDGAGTTIIDGQNAQSSSDIAFTAANDQQDKYSVTLYPTLDNTGFAGQVGVTIGAPTPGSYTTTLVPTYAPITPS